MHRRDFITLLSGAAAAWPLAVRAQQSKMPVIGFLGAGSPDRDGGRVRAFRQGLSQAGYVEGRNVDIEFRWTDSPNQFSFLVADFVRRRVTAIAALGGPRAALAAKAATATIPIIFQTSNDPVALGLVASLARPGGNLTGVTSLNVEVGPKRLELLHELVPEATAIALLINPTNPDAESFSRDMKTAAHTLGLELHILNATTEREFDAVFTTLLRLQAGALLIAPDTFFTNRVEQLAALALRYKVPAIHQTWAFAAAGGMLGYGTDLVDQYRQVGGYTARVLKGEKPADLPVQQATKVGLIINLKTAKALGITVPITLLGLADEVIE